MFRKSRPRQIACLVAGLILLFIIGMYLMSFLASRPENLGVRDGRLAPCPESPNCVSTQADDPEHRMQPIEFASSATDALRAVKRVVERMPRTRIIHERENYLYAEFRSRVFRFVDDVEFLVDEQAGRIHFRSASRVGYSDFGANRRRMERLSAAVHSELGKS